VQEFQKEKRKYRRQEALIAVLREASLGQSPNPRTCFQCGQVGHLRRECPGESYLRDLPHFLGKKLEGTLSPVPRGTEARASHPMMGPWASHPGPIASVKSEEPRVKHKVSFLINTGASISAIPFSPGPRFSKKITILGISGQPLEHYFTQLLACSWGDLHFCHSFLIVAETPTLLGQKPSF
jgi:hypothetical protein